MSNTSMTPSLIEWYREDNQKLNAEARRLESAVKQLTSKVRDLENVVESLTLERNAALKILWAAAHSLGGRLEIPDKSLIAAEDPENQLASHYDPHNSTTVLRSVKSGQDKN